MKDYFIFKSPCSNGFVTENSKKDVDEVIEIVKAVKRHLAEPDCCHSIDFIVKEALPNEK
jgi:hypothetical protein